MRRHKTCFSTVSTRHAVRCANSETTAIEIFPNIRQKKRQYNV